MSVLLLRCVECESEFDISTLPAGKQYRCSICETVLEIPIKPPIATTASEATTEVPLPTPVPTPISAPPEPSSEEPPKKKKKTSLEASLSISSKKEEKKKKKESSKKEDFEEKTSTDEKKIPEKKGKPEKSVESSETSKKPKKERERTSRLKKVDLQLKEKQRKEDAEDSPQETEVTTLVPVNKSPTREDGPKLVKKPQKTAPRKKTERLVKSEIRREVSAEEHKERLTKTRASSAPKTKKKPPILLLGGGLGAVLIAVILFFAFNNSTSSKKNREPDSNQTQKNPASDLRKKFDEDFEIAKNTPEKLFALSAWCKENNLEDEQKICLIRILEVDPEHEGALVALGRKKPEKRNPFDDIFGKQYNKKADGSLIVASDGLPESELSTILTSATPIFEAFCKDFAGDLEDRGFNAQLPPFSIAVFSSQEKYQEFCKNLKEERAAKEAGLLQIKQRTLLSYPKIEVQSGTVGAIGNPGNLLNSSLLYEAYIDSNKTTAVVPKLNLMALKHLKERYFAVLTDHYFIAMQNDESYVSKLAVQSYVNLLEMAYKWIYDHYREEWGLKEYEFLMALYIFRDRKEFRAYGKMDEKSTVLGFYEPWNHQMFAFRAPADPTIEQVVIHEGTHMIMHYFTGFRPPNQFKELFWFQEGIAEFFGSWDKDKEGNYILEALNKMRFGDLWGQAVSKSEDPKVSLMPFKRALSLSVTDSHSFEEKEKAQVQDQLYRQGWGMVHFFMKYNDGKYRKQFAEYVKAYINGTSSWPTFAKIFNLKNQSQLDQMEEEFREYIKSLKKQKK